MSLFFYATQYLKYCFFARNQHFIHPPFAYQLYDSVIKGKQVSPKHQSIESMRNKLIGSKEIIQVSDFGAGSKMASSSGRRISDIAKHGISPSKFSNLFYRLGNTLNNPQILELGTSLGINTLYLSCIQNADVITLEGCPNLANWAQKEFEEQGVKNIQIQVGNIDQTLPELIQKVDRLDMVLLDANHLLAPTLQYFELCLSKASDQCIFIFDDIHWSPEMAAAWEKIKKHPRVSLTIDLYKVGLVFIRPLKQKQHYILWF